MIELVDEKTIQQLIADTSSEVMPMLIDQYIEEMQHRIENIERAFSSQDYAQLEFETHALGSSAQALGNQALSHLARTIEHLCIDNEHENALSYQKDFATISSASLIALNNRKRQGF
ncbi:Hpt domain-containing protein [Vibrio kasasachensis]|uniref:Hpt domain-containing protein n=1 Tax=Vibrio kasasachensis TaxID=2910248 RepID=UPI003D098E0E